MNIICSFKHFTFTDSFLNVFLPQIWNAAQATSEFWIKKKKTQTYVDSFSKDQSH